VSANSLNPLNKRINNIQNVQSVQTIQQCNIPEEEYIVEMFGRKGWICEMCNNFNYETRVKCNRCGINKSPKRNVKKNKTDDSDDEEKKKKPFSERVGDWVCIKCKNLNFSFRVVCNRCQMPKMENEKMFQSHMEGIMNYVKMNEMMHAQMMIQNNGNLPYPNYINNNSISISNNYYPNIKTPVHNEAESNIK